ncbi:hypothetical protein ACK3TF_004756 [Chlorella vulgaris]
MHENCLGMRLHQQDKTGLETHTCQPIPPPHHRLNSLHTAAMSKRSIVQYTQALVAAGVMETPSWMAALLRTPPLPPVRTKKSKPPKITFPEDELLLAYYRKHPEARLEPIDLASFEPPTGRRFALRQLELMQHKGLGKRSAAVQAEREFAEQRMQADAAAGRSGRQSIIDQIQAEEEQHLQQALRQYANKHGATVVRQHALELSQQQHLQRQRSQQQQDTQLRTQRPQGAQQVQVQQAQPRPAAPQVPKRAHAAPAAAGTPNVNLMCALPPPMVTNPHFIKIPHPHGSRFRSRQQFYPFYLGEHSNRTCRRLHVAGTTGVVALAASAAATWRPGLLLLCPLLGYGCAWLGHYLFEHNRPATFRYPLWSLASDFQLCKEAGWPNVPVLELEQGLGLELRLGLGLGLGLGLLQEPALRQAQRAAAAAAPAHPPLAVAQSCRSCAQLIVEHRSGFQKPDGSHAEADQNGSQREAREGSAAAAGRAPLRVLPSTLALRLSCCTLLRVEQALRLQVAESSIGQGRGAGGDRSVRSTAGFQVPTPAAAFIISFDPMAACTATTATRYSATCQRKARAHHAVASLPAGLRQAHFSSRDSSWAPQSPSRAARLVALSAETQATTQPTEWLQRVIELPPLSRGCHVITRQLLKQLPELAEYEVGIATLFVQHTSCSLTINENASPDVPLDLADSLDRLAPEGGGSASLMGMTLVIPVQHGRLALGMWQGIYLNEHRNYGGPRRLVITVQGQKRADGRTYSSHR